MAALCDELRKRLEAYKDSRNAAEQQERWRHAVVLHSEIMEVWKSAFLNARAAVDDYLRNYDLSSFFTGREMLVDSLHGRCKPSVGIALSVMQFESERNLRTLAEIPVELAVSCDMAARKLLRVVSTSKYR
ncbi:hypothetical protein HB779_16315 [Phyllobacterium sp. 628]|uniref:hypothetical protein n=1 Tax=Phyllobacterium sp. 628 TaxID=2718938 RepID=UPI00166279E7|nr:hypothetical protein [Phyllobacterium sp. 628]QND53281.1 hypothetical protein HB779_16315 [Phyllobacterium sp. 628]